MASSFFGFERDLFAITKASVELLRTTAPTALETSKDFFEAHAGTFATVGNVFETVGTIVTGLSDDPRLVIPGAILTGIGKATRQFGSRQQTISFRDMSRKRRRNGRSRNKSRNFGITPRRRRSQLLKRKASNLMRIEMLERALTDIPKKEIKNHDVRIPNLAINELSPTENALKLSAVPQGFSLNERIGEQIEAVSLQWSVNISRSAIDTEGLPQSSVLRMVIFVDSEAIDSAVPQAQAFFQDTNPTDILSFYIDKFPSRYLVLVDRPYVVKWHREQAEITDGGRVNIRGMKIRYNGPLVTQTGKNNIFMFVIADNEEFFASQPLSLFSFKSRLQFTG